MQWTRRFIAIVAVQLLLLPAANAQDKYYADLDAVLGEAVSRNGLVDYSRIDEGKLNAFLRRIAEVPSDSWSKDARLALYINAYNACVLRQVLDHQPLASPRDVKDFFTEQRFRIAGETLSLDKIEHTYVIPLGGATIHFGLVCAAQSCPPLRREAYTAASVRKALKENGRIFLRDPGKNRLDRKNGVLYLSEIFSWFHKDFESAYGSVEKAAAAFMSKEDRQYIGKNKVKVKFLPYDWALNQQ